MQHLARAILVSLMLAAPSAAHAQVQTQSLASAGGLAEACVSRDESDRKFCQGMLYGVVQSAKVYNEMKLRNGTAVLPPEGRVLCPPSRISLETLRDTYVRWVRSHNVARMSSSQAAFNAMADAYPCRSNRGDSLFDGSIFGDRSMFGDEDFSFIPRVGPSR